MSTFFKFLLAFIGVLLLGFAINWGMTELDVKQEAHFAPKYEQVRHDTFKKSQAYTDGQAKQLQAYQLEYVRGDAAQKQAIASMVLHDMADVDESALPSNLYAFLQQIKQSQGVQ